MASCLRVLSYVPWNSRVLQSTRSSVTWKKFSTRSIIVNNDIWQRSKFPVTGRDSCFSFSTSRLFSDSTTEISTTLHQHLEGLMSRKLLERATMLSVENRDDWSKLASPLVNNLMKYKDVIDNRTAATIGTDLSRAIRHATYDELYAASYGDLGSSTQSIDSLLTNLNNRQAEARHVFRTIRDHHANIAETNQWENVVADTNALASYASAAAAMGKKAWVRRSNDWIAQFAVSFFRQGGARKHFVKSIPMETLLSGRPATDIHSIRRDLESTLPKDLLSWSTTGEQYKQNLHSTLDSRAANIDIRPAGDSVSNSLSALVSSGRPIRLLDVGSCYNPLSSSPVAPALAITAVDLFPASDSVFQCDFITLKVGPPDSEPIWINSTIERTNAETGQLETVEVRKLIQLPARSFDVVSMSLVISYLPTPALRERMIAKARLLLRDPSSMGGGIGKPNTPSTTFTDTPHYAGLLLLIEKESIFGSMQERDSLMLTKGSLLADWKDCISSLGFYFTKYNFLNSDGTHVHAFAFTTDSLNSLAGDVTVHPDIQTEGIPTIEEANVCVAVDGFRRSSSLEKKKPHLFITKDFHDADSTMMAEKQSLDPSHYISPLLKRLPIGIVGGGLGGSALALALQSKKIPFRLYERDEGFNSRRQGYALTMQQGGIALRDLEVTDSVLADGAISVVHYSYDHLGNLIGKYGAQSDVASYADAPLTDTAAADMAAGNADRLTPIIARGRHNVHIPRQSLRDILLTNVDSSNIHWNKTFFDLCASPVDSSAGDDPSVRLQFADGTVDDCSIVVAADGIYSGVRDAFCRQLAVASLGSENSLTKSAMAASSLQYLGLMVVLGIADIPSTLDGRYLCQRQWVDGRSRVFTMPFDKERTMWQLSYPLNENSAVSLSSLQKRDLDEVLRVGAKLKSEATSLLAGWDPALRRILDATDEMAVSGHPVYDRPVSRMLVHQALDVAPPMSGWLSRVTILGDACHPMSPFKGQGANQALLDAHKLASTLVKCYDSSDHDIASSLRDYEVEMAVRARSKVLKSHDAAAYLHAPEALVKGNITRAKAAETLSSTTRSIHP